MPRHEKPSLEMSPCESCGDTSEGVCTLCGWFVCRECRKEHKAKDCRVDEDEFKKPAKGKQ